MIWSGVDLTWGRFGLGPIWPANIPERRLHLFKFSDGYKSTMPMDWCSVYLAHQALPKYIYLSPPLIFPTTYNMDRLHPSREYT
jgi:hypothetical protein